MASQTFIEKAYLAYFGRPADTTGLLDFASSTNAEVETAFATSPESIALFGAEFTMTTINTIYHTLFGRDAEPDGLTYWYNRYLGTWATPEAPKLTATGVAMAILEAGLLTADKTALENKLATSHLFTQSLDTTPEILAYSGDAAAEAARSFLSGVTSTAATQAQVDAAVAGLGDSAAPVVTAAQTFTYAENQTATAVLGTVLATDDHAVTGFSLDAATTKAGLFAIDATGKITLTAAGIASTANDFDDAGAGAANTFTLGVTATDAAGNTSAATNVVLTVTDVDDQAPALVGATAAATTVKLNFNEAFKAGTVISNPSAVFTVTQGTTSYAVSAASITGGVVTLTLATGLTSGDVFVSYTGSVLEDAAGNKVAAIAPTKASSDIVAPTLASSSPADNSISAVAAANLVLTFSEDVVLGTGSFTIVNATDATDTRTISVGDASQVTVSGNTVTINPTADLKTGVAYYVNIAGSAVLDTSGNVYAGISNATDLNFTTVAAVVPGTTQVLTKSVQALTGGDGNDIFIAGDDGGSVTLNAGDQVDGGLGVNTLKIYNTGAAPIVLNGAAFTSAVVTNVQNVELTTGTTAQTLDVSGNAGVKMATLTNGFDGVITLKLAQTAGLAGTIDTFAAQIGFTFVDNGGPADTATLQLTDAVLVNAAGVGGGVAIAGVETLNIIATGKNVLSAAAMPGISSAATKLVISGSGSLNTNLSGANLVKTIDGSTSTGNLVINNSLAGVQVESIKTGTGNDIYTTQWANLTSADAIDLNLGTDSLRFIDNATFMSAGDKALLTLVSGVEQLGVTGAFTLLADGDFESQTSYYADDGGTLTLTNVANGASAFFGIGANAATIGMKVVPNAAVSLDLAGSATVASGAVVNVTGSTTVNVNSSGTVGVADNNLVLGAADNQLVKVTGSQNLTLTTFPAFATTGFTTDAAAFTGKLDVTGSAFQDVIKGGTGADKITGGAQADILTGNGGVDKFAFAGADSTLATVDTITDYRLASGTNAGAKDTIDLTGVVAVIGTVSTVQNLSAQATLGAALDAAAAGNGNAVGLSVFLWGGDTYAYVETAAAGAAYVAGDTVIKLTGVVATAGSAVAGLGIDGV